MPIASKTWQTLTPRLERLSPATVDFSGFPQFNDAWWNNGAKIDANQFDFVAPMSKEQITNVYYNLSAVNLNVTYSSAFGSQKLEKIEVDPNIAYKIFPEGYFDFATGAKAYDPYDRNFAVHDGSNGQILGNITTGGTDQGGGIKAELFGNWQIIKIYNGTPLVNENNLVGYGFFKFLEIVNDGSNSLYNGDKFTHNVTLSSVASRRDGWELSRTEVSGVPFMKQERKVSLQGYEFNREGEVIRTDPPSGDTQVSSLEFFTYP